MSYKKILSLITLIALIALLITGVFLFRADIQNLLGVRSSYSTPSKDIRGEAITFTVGDRVASIPPMFSEKVLSFIKQEMTENGGLPLKIERKGNPLPFGIP